MVQNHGLEPVCDTLEFPNLLHAEPVRQVMVREIGGAVAPCWTVTTSNYM
jgi:hypothetical protein